MRLIPASMLLLLPLLALNPARADWTLDLETGVAQNTYNYFRIPGTTGTGVSLNREFDVGPITYQRWRLTYHRNEKEEWSLLYAPLTFHATGTPTSDLDFNGTTFAAGTPLSGSYTFNSYRLTYRRNVHPERDFSYSWGFTAKIRDAEIRLSDGVRTSSNTNVGFVPLLNLGARWKMGNHWSVLLDADALAAPQGRAEDVYLGLDYRFSDSMSARLGYRLIEGGADNDRVYNFSTIQCVTFGITGRF